VIRIGLIGDFNPRVTAHRAIPLALQLAGERAGCAVEPTWLHTSTLRGDVSEHLAGFAGLWCVPASPYANSEGALAAIGYARQCGMAFLGTCGGFQYALLEYIRNVLGMHEAEHAEETPDAALALLSPLSCALVEKADCIMLAGNSRLRRIYGVSEVQEEYHCRYGLNPVYEQLLSSDHMSICGRDRRGEVRAVELQSHPFFFATLFQPERAALRGKGHPLVNAFVAAAAAS